MRISDWSSDVCSSDLRWERFMAAQQAISATRLKAKVGRTLDVIIDETKRTTATGRTYADAPEIDGIVKIRHAAGLQTGAIVKEIGRASCRERVGRSVKISVGADL